MAGFAALGRWQLQRGELKQSMLDRVAAVLVEKRALPISEAQARDRHGYDWVAGNGRLLGSTVLLLDNQRRGEAVGVRVLAVLHPREGQPLLVDLGWLPVPGNRHFPAPALPTGEIRVEGLLSPPPGAGLALGPSFAALDPAGATQRLLLTRVDLADLSRQLRLPLAPRLLRLDPALPFGYARDLQVLPNTLPPERHRGYALQWFGLAFATFVTAVFMSLRRPSR
ncbi:MAG: SURF1 family protein [Arenimonas sp.]